MDTNMLETKGRALEIQMECFNGAKSTFFEEHIYLTRYIKKNVGIGYRQIYTKTHSIFSEIYSTGSHFSSVDWWLLFLLEPVRGGCNCKLWVRHNKVQFFCSIFKTTTGYDLNKMDLYASHLTNLLLLMKYLRETSFHIERTYHCFPTVLTWLTRILGKSGV